MTYATCIILGKVFLMKDNDCNDPSLRSWVESANGGDTDFPIQNLPFGVFSRKAGPAGVRRVGVAIGDFVLDVAEAWPELYGDDPYLGIELFDEPSLNVYLSAGREIWTLVRETVSGWLRTDNPVLRDNAELRKRVLIALDDVELHLPVEIGDYTDFYASKFHATNVGSMFRPDNPLMPNWQHLPVGYHGRSSSIVVSGTDVVRPCGQTIGANTTKPSFGPSRLIDYELEVGFITGPGNEMGVPIAIEDAADHIFGLVLLNDWSARDVQKWEYQPLGPFLAKNFASTISPWVVSLDALEPFRVKTERDGDDPKVLPYLDGGWDWGLDIDLEVELETALLTSKGMDAVTLTRSNFKYMYWNICHQLAHQTCTGCNVRPGDMCGSGTVSGPEKHERGCLLELTWRGTEPIELPSGEERRFLADGDTIIMKAHAGGGESGRVRIGFGECRGTILPSLS